MQITELNWSRDTASDSKAGSYGFQVSQSLSTSTRDSVVVYCHVFWLRILTGVGLNFYTRGLRIFAVQYNWAYHDYRTRLDTS